METMRHTLDLHTLLWDDGVVEFFPMVDTESEFEGWTKRAIEQGDGTEFRYEDGWCRRYGRYLADGETLELTFVSAGADGTFDTEDDIPVTWHGQDAPN
jgi:hypothetical protein